MREMRESGETRKDMKQGMMQRRYLIMGKFQMSKFIRRISKIVSWSIGVSFILSVLMGGITAYGVSYQGMDMPIWLETNEDENWSQILDRLDKGAAAVEGQVIENQVVVKAVLGFIGEGGCTGRDPPQEMMTGIHKLLNKINKLSEFNELSKHRIHLLMAQNKHNFDGIMNIGKNMVNVLTETRKVLAGRKETIS